MARAGGKKARFIVLPFSPGWIHQPGHMLPLVPGRTLAETKGKNRRYVLYQWRVEIRGQLDAISRNDVLLIVLIILSNHQIRLRN